MKNDCFDFSIASDVDYEDLIADIGVEDQLFAILSQEEGYDKMRIKIYPPQEGDCWDLSLSTLERTIRQVKERLWELRRKPD